MTRFLFSQNSGVISGLNSGALARAQSFCKDETLVYGRRARLPPRARSRVVAGGPSIFDPRLRPRAFVAAVRDSSRVVRGACPRARGESERERLGSPRAMPRRAHRRQLTQHRARARARATPVAQAKEMARQLYQKISKKPAKDASAAEVGSLADLDEARACRPARVVRL